jgi:hypothetical protein
MDLMAETVKKCIKIKTSIRKSKMIDGPEVSNVRLQALSFPQNAAIKR